jgi:hypothetical protein
MCCFSGSPGVVELVSKTNIFARGSGSSQLLAYSMNVAAKEPVAMILPLPVPPGSAEDAVRFIDLSGYGNLFADLDKAFPPIVIAAPASRGPSRGGGVMQMTTLEVHKVGSFEASFVPSLAEFARLDARFRISDEVWRALPQYSDYGFCVFKLGELRQRWWRSQVRTIHPMALEFPRRDGRLFFPTVHVHDGAVHETASFDHTLYYQAEGELSANLPQHLFRQSSAELARQHLDVTRTAGLIDGDAALRRILVMGEHPNRDIVLA